MHNRTSKQRKATRRRRWIQHLLGLGCPAEYLVYLSTPPERMRLTRRERVWAENVAAKLEETRGNWSDVVNAIGSDRRLL